jgi:IMP dehydrogenase/GMP reductase
MKAFTHDDILMVPSYNHWESRTVVDISMKCKTGKLFLQVPLMTASMDTITESDMANFIGENGGIGVLHRYMTIKDNIRMFKGAAAETGPYRNYIGRSMGKPAAQNLISFKKHLTSSDHGKAGVGIDFTQA